MSKFNTQFVDLNENPELAIMAQSVSNQMSHFIEAHKIQPEVVICVTAAVVADYARAFGNEFLAEVTKLMQERADAEMPPNAAQATAMAEKTGEKVH